MSIDLSNDAIKDLVDTLNRKKAIVIVGTGVSSATLPEKQRRQFGTWTSLLAYGISYCCDYCGAEKSWADQCTELLNRSTTSLDDLLNIGDQVWDRIHTSGKLEEWLDVFDNADRENGQLIQAIKKLNAPIATANYDRLLEEVTYLSPVTLLQEDKGHVQNFINGAGSAKYILHLHGYYKKPSSIVLGARSYEAIINNEYAQFINQFLAAKSEIMLFVGFGQGVHDPNFRLIFQWVDKYFPFTILYHLVKDDQVEETQKAHKQNGNKKVVVMGYGKDYGDIIPFFTSLSYEIDRKEDVPKSLPGKPTCIGKERLEKIESIAGYLLEKYTRPYGILGTGGMGKTNLALNVSHHKKIANKYGRHRYFIGCDGATSFELLCNRINAVLEIPAGGSSDPGVKILNHFLHIEEDKLVVLDNFETPWDNDKDKVAAFVNQLQDVCNLVFTMRGDYPPYELDWESYKTKKLKPEEAEMLFHAHSGKRFSDNPLAKKLVDELGHHPLSVELMAKRSKTVEKLDTLYTEWKERKTRLLAIDAKNKNLNLELSIQLSFESPRLTDDDRIFLKTLSTLPIGIRRTDLGIIFPNAFDLLDHLKFAGLCEEDPETERITILAPIREYILGKEISPNDYLSSIKSFYVTLAYEKGVSISYEVNAFLLLQAEWSNLESILETMLHTIGGINALVSLTLFCQFSGNDPTPLLLKAAANADILNEPWLKANCIKSLGDIAFRKSRHELAEQYYNEALLLFEKAGDLSGQADCIRSLGELAFHQSSNELANQLFDRALILYEKSGGVFGQANCIINLGYLAYNQSNHELAEQFFNKALPLCETGNYMLGKANCIQSLGELAFSQSRDEQAGQFFNQALLIYEKLGDLLGQANSIRSLGDMAFRQSNNELAERLYNQALPLYEKVGTLLGQANCFQSLGDLEMKRENLETAGRLFHRSLELYKTIQDSYSQGLVYRLLGLLHEKLHEPEIANDFFCKTKTAWLKGGYEKLIEEHKLSDIVCPG